ncbi:TPA: MAPEG family protein [Enterobacter kobei]|nr:MAPEG family protein [Pseudomonas aeruginosa]HEG1747370.1 MAPEG family protein [Enterobacter kobei]HEG1825254.1 MAPEG family protein [Enterobacter kobei]HEG2124469.1 MAPEG family protein [Enterobacter kobei]HEG2175291.1 MAPEG family protein [Enterobacter kobei]
MKPELMSLTIVTTFTALLWIPYVLNRMLVRGIPSTVGYPQDPPPLAPWAQRLRLAHANAVENLVVFAPLALSVHMLGQGTPATEMAGWLYVSSRVAHALLYTAKVPWLRTLAFIGGWLAQMILALRLLGV